ncbi:MAG: TRZ/ATZ family hydrolase [Gammaproteobacteria bacterium]|nr:TRZ/ATZ family hydrolase [Gammaproteobacteria bacterium]
MPQPIDLIINARWVIPVTPDRPTLNHYSVAVHAGEIIEVLPTVDASQKYAGANVEDLGQHVLIPGFVNTHTHAAMTLFRGWADDMPLRQWLSEYIWPAETRWISAEFVRAGTDLAVAEMIRGGTTCFNDMYFFPDVVAQAANRAGIRASIGLILIDFPTAWAEQPSEYLEKGLRLHDEVKNLELVSATFAPHAPYTVSDEPLTKLRVLADELDIPIHMHVHETEHEIEESMTRYGVRPLERLSQLGLLTNRLIAVHMTQLLSQEIEAVANSGVNVVHCPESNLKLASGLCPVTELLGAQVNVTLGTDGAASNNDLDMLGELRTAALLAKGVSGDPTALPAHTALEMATLNGAKALGLEHQIGSIEVGKQADLVAVDLNQLDTQPVYHALTQLVYSASRSDITHVWVHGRKLLTDRHLLTMDQNSVSSAAAAWAKKIGAHRHGSPSLN